MQGQIVRSVQAGGGEGCRVRTMRIVFQAMLAAAASPVGMPFAALAGLCGVSMQARSMLATAWEPPAVRCLCHIHAPPVLHDFPGVAL